MNLFGFGRRFFVNFRLGSNNTKKSIQYFLTNNSIGRYHTERKINKEVYLTNLTEFAKTGDLNLKKWLEENNHDISENRDLLYLCTQRKSREGDDFTRLAAEYGNLQVLNWLSTNGFKINEYASYEASMNGHIDILDWLRENKFPIRLLTCLQCENLIRENRLNVLKWYKNEGLEIPFDTVLTDRAVWSNNLEILKWLVEENRCPINKIYCLYIAEKKRNKEIIKYLNSLWINPINNRIIFKSKYNSNNDNNVPKEKEENIIDMIDIYNEDDEKKVTQFIAKKMREHQESNSEIPEKLKKLIDIRNKRIEMKEILRRVDIYGSHNKFFDFTSTLQKLVIAFDPKIVEFLENNKYLAVNNQTVNMFDLLIFTHKFDNQANNWVIGHFTRGFLNIPNGFCDNCALNGNLESLKYFTNLGYPISSTVSYHAAKYGHIEILKWLKDGKYPIMTLVSQDGYFSLIDGLIIGLIDKERLDVFKWYEENGYELPIDLPEKAVNNGSLKILKWLIENNHPIDLQKCMRLAKEKNMREIIDFLNSR